MWPAKNPTFGASYEAFMADRMGFYKRNGAAVTDRVLRRELAWNARMGLREVSDTRLAVDESVSIALDLPTQIGYDSDAQQADGEVGKVGVAIDSLRDAGPASGC